MENIDIRFQPQLKDHIRASIVHYRAGRLRIGDKVVGTIALAAGLWLLFWGRRPPLLAAVLCFAGCAEWTDWLHAHTLRAWLSFKRNRKFREEYTITFMPKGMHFKTVSIDSIVSWAHYDGVVEDSAVILLMSGKSFYSVIPKRAFDSNEKLGRFREIVQAAIPKYVMQRL